MNRNEYKTLINQIVPDEGLEQRILKKLKRKNPRTIRLSRMGVAVASVAAMIGLGLVISLAWSNEKTPATYTIRPSVDSPALNQKEDPGAVTIPKIGLPKQSNAMADMIGLIVYKGNIYTQTGTRITPETAKQLRGDKLGRSKAGIDEWSQPSDYTELASTIGEMDVYSVKEYDEDFRIMSYQEDEGQIYAELYERLNGITIATGGDLFGKLNLKGSIKSVKWQDFGSWDMGKDSFHELEMESTLQDFVKKLYEAKPVAEDQLYKAGIYESEAEDQKFLYFMLQDGTEVQLRLFKSGNYVKYAAAPVFFQLEPEVFSALWERM